MITNLRMELFEALIEMGSPGSVRADAGGAEGPLVQGVPLVHHLPARDAELAQQVQALPATVNTSTAYTARYLDIYIPVFQVGK